MSAGPQTVSTSEPVDMLTACEMEEGLDGHDLFPLPVPRSSETTKLVEQSTAAVVTAHPVVTGDRRFVDEHVASLRHERPEGHGTYAGATDKIYADYTPER